MKSFEQMGLWWLPDQETNAVAGVLRFSRTEGLELRLVGSLSDTPSKAPDEIPIILGAVEGHGSITLESARSAGFSFTTGGPFRERYRPDVAYSGAHLDTPNSREFSRVRVMLQFLVDWARVPPIRIHRASKVGEGSRIEALCDASSPIAAADTPCGTVRLVCSHSYTGNPKQRIELSRNAEFNVELKEAMDIEEIYQKVVLPLQKLVSLGTDRATALLSLVVNSSSSTYTLSDGIERPNPLEVYFRTRLVPVDDPGVLAPHRMLFTYQDIASHFSASLSKWMECFSDLENTIALTTHSLYSENIGVDRAFLMLAQAAEVYHRRRFPGERLPKPEFRKRRKEILGVCPYGLRSWLKGEFRWQNEFSLRDRLRQLVASAGESLPPVVGDVDEFIKDVVGSRNYYTHYSEHLKRSAAKEKDLYFLSQALSVLIRSCLLEEIHVPLESRKALFGRNQQYAFLLSEAPMTLHRIFFRATTKAERDSAIVAAVTRHGYTRRDVAEHLGLHATTVGRIVAAKLSS
ncbi:hypothetical protein JW848_09780 [Candidatus Bipolaricaulota bacterium]|nr:hypothetical protein [Candidatus Bipolaricaulota bacterium]